MPLDWSELPLPRARGDIASSDVIFVSTVISAHGDGVVIAKGALPPSGAGIFIKEVGIYQHIRIC